MNDQPRTDPLSSNIKAIADLEKTATASRSAFARLCDRITQEAGTPWSIGLHVAIFSGWVLVNSRWFSRHPLNPFPFQFLTTVLSIEAIVLTVFVLSSQNHLTRESDKRAQLDLQVNLLAE